MNAILLFIFLLFIGIGLPDSILGAAWPYMSEDFDVNVGDAGVISIMISVGIILASLYVSRLKKRMSFSLLSKLGLLLMSIALALSAVADNIYVIAFCSLPLGFGSGILQTTCNEYVSNHYESKHMCWLHGAWGIGAVTGTALISYMAETVLSWRTGYCIVALLEIFAFIGAFFAFRNKPALSRVKQTQTNGMFKLTLKEMRTKIFVVFQYFLYCSMENSVMLWGASYLIAAKGFEADVAAKTISLYFCGVTFGRFGSGLLLAKIKAHTFVRACVAGCTAGCVVLLVGTSVPVTAIALLFLGCVMSPLYPTLLYATPKYFPNEDHTALMGIQVASAYLGILFIPALLGKLFEKTTFVIFPAVIAAAMCGVLVCASILRNKIIKE
ncbi:MAG: MFS transporter [Clostridiales bacterium]|nr:MFS transporter [Clostridiales bacterium]